MIKEILVAKTGLIFRETDSVFSQLGIVLDACGMHPSPFSEAIHSRQDMELTAHPPPPERGDSRNAMEISEKYDRVKFEERYRPPKSAAELDSLPSPYLPVGARPADVVAPLHDALSDPLWWPLEFMPFISSYQDSKDRWHNNIR
jgi:hypothetical protein